MWLSIRSENDLPDWTGSISAPNGSGAYWRFEVKRRIYRDLSDLFAPPTFHPLSSVATVSNEPCTLIWPRIEWSSTRTSFDSGYTTQHIKGIAKGVLFSSVLQSEDKHVLGIKFSFDALTNWLTYGRRLIVEQEQEGVRYYGSRGLPSYEIGLGCSWRCTIQSRHEVLEELNNVSLTSIASLDLSSKNPTTLDEAIKVGSALAMLFRFLTGKYLSYHELSIRIGDTASFVWRGCSLGGIRHEPEEMSRPRAPIHYDELCAGSIESIVLLFWEKHDVSLPLMNTVEVARLESDYILKFRLLAPTLERYLRDRYRTLEGSNFKDSEQKFFLYINSSNDPAICDFSKAHIKIVDRKTLSFKQLIEAAIACLSDKGLVIPPEYASRISKRRHTFSHNGDPVSASDFGDFYLDVQCALIILVAHIYLDIGVPVNVLAVSEFVSYAMHQITNFSYL